MMEEDKRFRITPAQQMMSSCSGALVTSLLVTPLDVIKIRLQSQQQAMLSNRCFLYCNGLMDHVCSCDNGKMNVWVKRPGHFTSTINAFYTIMRSEGPLSLWSGLPPTLIMAVPSTIIYFVSYEELRVRFYDRYSAAMGTKEQPIWIPLAAGGLGRLWAVTVVSPLELLRTKMQSKRLSYRELRNACADLYGARGWRGFWLGYGPTVSRDVPFSAIYWCCYESIKKLFLWDNGNNAMGGTSSPSLLFSFGAGAVAGSIAGTLTLPFDVVKTHKQIQMGDMDFNVKGKKLSSTLDILQTIYKSSGIHGLFTGLIPRIVRVAPACAIMISSYEFGKRYFYSYNMKKYNNPVD